jgi:hypothetical protein
VADVSRWISRLRAIGYRFYLEGDSIRFKYTRNGEPPQEKVAPLLDALRQHKAEVVRLLSKTDNGRETSRKATYCPCGNIITWKTEHIGICRGCSYVDDPASPYKSWKTC